MKLSLSWIFDHIDADWRTQDVDLIVKKFNEITAEIEHVHRVTFDLDSCALGTVIRVDDKQCELEVQEWKTRIMLPLRQVVKDPYHAMYAFMVRRDGNKYRWSQCTDFGLEKGGSLPPFSVNANALDGSWKKKIDAYDVIFEVDNKSITHRPDMWGHRGFAREIAAYLKLPFKDASNFLAPIGVEHFDAKIESTATQPFLIENRARNACSQFATFYISHIELKPCDIALAFRLMRVGSRPINGIVDLTNYVMLDWSQPMHAFDANKIADNTLMVRMAQQGEQLKLLDERVLSLTPDDIVIANGKEVMGLAGIMGGINDSISAKTSSILLESAHFEPNYIRKSALRHKSRTEASARFEKKLDPNQVTDAIARFVKLAKDTRLSCTTSQAIMCIGNPFIPPTITVSHHFLETRAGFALTQEDIIDPLTRLGFKVIARNTEYEITIPSYRASKDVTRPEDILEEVIRFYGFNRIKPVLPAFVKSPHDLDPLMRLRTIKTYLAGAAHMTEICSYALFNEQILHKLGLDLVSDTKRPKEPLELLNPISEHFRRPVSSLVPALLESVIDNAHNHDELNFFELARTWHEGHYTATLEKISERKTVSGIFFQKRKQLNFYACKAKLDGLFTLLNAPVTWVKCNDDNAPQWSSRFEVATLLLQGDVIGHAGKINPTFLPRLGVLEESDAWIFELDADLLINYKPATVRYKPISKYQESDFDLSFVVPLARAVSDFVAAFNKIDPLIRSVQLIDFFEKESWHDTRALAFRFIVGSDEKTLQKEEIEAVRERAIAAAVALGATLRT